MHCAVSVILGTLLLLFLISATYSAVYAYDDRNYYHIVPGSSDCAVEATGVQILKLLERKPRAPKIPARLVRSPEGKRRVQLLSAKAPKVTMLMVYADWCTHCKSFKPKFLEASTKCDEVEWKLMNGDENREAVKKLGVMGYPAVIKLQGKEAIMFKGPRTCEALIDFATS